MSENWRTLWPRREKCSSTSFSRRENKRRISAIATFFVTLIALSSLFQSSHASSDGCDWTGSGLESDSSPSSSSSSGSADHPRGVRPVYLRCSQGSVAWLYPRGALRVVLRYGTAGKEFQGCLKLSADFAGANIYVERHRTLKLLHGASTSMQLRPDGKRHCFESHKGQVAIFLESDPPVGGADPLRRETASFDYDLQLVEEEQDDHHNRSPDPWQECRPCSEKESLELFCSSDFVARGTISSIYNDAQMERTLLTVRATRVIRQASTVFEPVRPAAYNNIEKKKKKKKRQATVGTLQPRFVPAPSKWKGMDGVEQVLNTVDDDVAAAAAQDDDKEEDEEHVGTLHLPLTCQVKHGSGEFVFMGRKRLGDAVLFCAPRLEEWQQWIQQAQNDGSAQCRLQF